METRFTPGPWKLLNVPKVNKKLHMVIGPVIVKNDISEPDAHLIAAAPELYEALEDSLAVLNEIAKIIKPMKNEPAIEKARAALAKARGESQ